MIIEMHNQEATPIDHDANQYGTREQGKEPIAQKCRLKLVDGLMDNLRDERISHPIAKGKNYLALRIRTLALNNQVPIIENPPLAQALYKSAEVGQEIPAHLYRAVAEILAYIYKLMNGRLPG